MSVDVAALVRDPFVLAYMQRAAKELPEGGQPQMHSPNQVIGEQRAFAIMLDSTERVAAASGKAGRSLAEDLLGAVPFLWLNKIDELAAALPIPRHTISANLFPYERCWWTFEGAHPIKPQEGGMTLGWADGVVLVTTPTRYVWGFVGQVGTALTKESATGWGLLTGGSFAPGAVWPDDIREQDRPAVGRLLAMQSFLDSPFVETTSSRAVGNAQKMRRSRPRLSPEMVRFVRLRSPLLSADQGRPIGHRGDWHVRWIVRGHIRAQWYPSAKSHKLIWIAPYEKGPEGAPLKMPAYAVVR